VCVPLTDLALSITACTEHLGCAPYGRHTLIRCAHPAGQPVAVTTLRYVSLLAQERCAKEGHPTIRVSLRETSLAPALLRGPAYMGRPWPFKRGRHRYLAASMRLVPLRNTSTRPPEGDQVASLRHLWKIKVGSVWILLLRRDLKDDAQVPFRRPSEITVEGVERHGCRESRDGPGMALHGVPLEW